MIKVGIIGCGKIAQLRHIPEFTKNPNADLIAYYDINFERASELAAKYGGKAYETVDELISDPEIDAISICAANHAHADLTIRSLKAGKHVLCEKPMASTLDQCIAMVEAAKETGKQLMIGQNQRFQPGHLQAKELIEKGVIGKVLTFDTVFRHGGPDQWSVDASTNNWFFDKAQSAFGAMADIGVHKTDLIQYLTGAKVVEVKALLRTIDKRYPNGSMINVDDNAFCIYQLDNGAAGTMSVSWTDYGINDSYTLIYGTTGQMRLYMNPEHNVEVLRLDGSVEYYDAGSQKVNDNDENSGIIDAFVEALESGKDVPIPGTDVLHAMKVIFAAEQSSKTGKTVRIYE